MSQQQGRPEGHGVSQEHVHAGPTPSPRTHSSTSRLNCFCLLPRNSPIICRLRPLRCNRKWATPTGVSGTKPRSMRYWMPFSGFLGGRIKDRLSPGSSGPSRLTLHLCGHSRHPS